MNLILVHYQRDGKASYGEDVMAEVINLLSLHALGQQKEERKKSEKEDEVAGEEQIGTAGGVEEMGISYRGGRNRES
ncbi:hypothetical protein C922_00423 [Plasmodium inui San Antonio 1]|uniref:Uncharacterized protein n=1 Tax=Plasmodium inui San Antonio 1 TaxID=1237626 RepID=W7ALB4_9APIC|nr:hypothetical protein C922_00423 [Plasmodium inui San Antonio 1]EUD69559.1 hypothetical protein C922_00423 [Plasmodium inui San Antonio 1]